ncbi:MAG: hypothetical protein WBG38_14740 [Nodosilinea sp.]
MASYDPTGLKALPIPIHTEDANQSILTFVEQQNSDGQETSAKKPSPVS